MPQPTSSTLTEAAKARPDNPPVRLGLIGLGTVGQGVCKIVAKNAYLTLEKIAVKDLNKKRGIDIDPKLLTTDPYEVINDAAISVIIEVAGGVDDAKKWIVQALNNKKHVITANKELIAKHGPELFKLAKQNNVRLLFEGAVAGGIPIIMPLKLSLAGNTIEEVAGILNGTTNYILTKMTTEKADYNAVLKDAQAKGFAEADPGSDVDGHDARYKTAILASIAFGKNVDPNAVFCEGITNISPLDISNADELGYVIKLLGIAKSENNQFDIRVHPVFVAKEHPLASIHNEFNAVWVRGDAVGEVMFYGRGAGELPTASAVMGDVLAICSELQKSISDPMPLMDFYNSQNATVLDIGETRNKYYIRLNTNDLPGVVGNLGTACGKHGVSLECVLQKGMHHQPDCENNTASIVLITHEVAEKNMQAALSDIRQQKTTQDVACVLRVWN